MNSRDFFKEALKDPEIESIPCISSYHKKN